MASNFPIFDRLVGLETEYAIRYRPDSPQTSRPSKYTLYRALTLALRKRLLTVPARHLKDGVFTATGGGVWYEVERLHADAGLVEGSTPECRGPRQVVCYQRAQDRLLRNAAKDAGLDGEFCLLKNDRDALGNVYGAQENYEATLATGWRLAAWRFGLVLLLPMVLLTWLGFLALIIGTLAYMAMATLFYFLFQSLDDSTQRLSLVLFGRDVTEGNETGQPCPLWLCKLLDVATRILTAPLAAALLVLIQCFAFRDTRRQLTPFLLSRCIVSGAGMVDEQGKFQLADKAPAMNCLVGYGGFLKDRPIFTFGHFFKSIFYDSCFSPRDYWDLLDSRQRLQIGLGDSNMAETAEYLRVGATLLVLDCIEAGEMPPVPRVRQPIASLRKLGADPSLKAAVSLSNGRHATALDLQRYYWEACRRFLEKRPDAPDQAHEVLARWALVLDRLEHERLLLVGEVDWITKQFLLDQAGPYASHASRKKIDLRYHELSEAGYFERLRKIHGEAGIVAEEEIERAMRASPPDSPATTRGHYIREFGGGEKPVSANWKYVFLGDGHASRAIRIADYGRVTAPTPKVRRPRKRGSDAV